VTAVQAVRRCGGVRSREPGDLAHVARHHLRAGWRGRFPVVGSRLARGNPRAPPHWAEARAADMIGT
jgi:hypothetical protein